MTIIHRLPYIDLLTAKKESKAIWDDEDVPSSAMFQDEDDDERPQPQ